MKKNKIDFFYFQKYIIIKHNDKYFQSNRDWGPTF